MFICLTGGIIIETPTCGSAAEGTRVGVGQATAYIDSSTNTIQVCCRVQGPEDTIVLWFLDDNPISNGITGYTILENGIKYNGPLPEGCVTYTCMANFSISAPNVQQSAKVCFGCKFYTTFGEIV